MTHVGWRLGHRPGLDGLRGVAILLVVAAHLNVVQLAPFGLAGVTVFFVLSGFLITSLLLQEWDGTGTISFRRFYQRRAVRLLPAFFVCMLVVIGVELWAWGRAPYAWAPFVEVANWVSVTHGAAELDLLHHTWSLSIEEQFYLAWPLVAVYALTRGGARAVFVVTCVGAAVSVGVGLLTVGERDAFGTDTNAVGLLVGCALAALFSLRPPRVAPAWVVPVAFAACGLVLVAGQDAARWCAIVAAMLGIWAASTRRTAVLDVAPLRGAGRISYGWYLWNYPLSVLCLRVDIPIWVAAPASLALALMSWRYIEEPLLSRFARRPERVPVHAAA